MAKGRALDSKVLIVGGVVSTLVLLLTAVVVWVAVIIAATKEPSVILTNASSQKSSATEETKGSARARSKTDSGAQAKSRRALEDDLTAQENFHLSDQEASQEANQDASQEAGQENLQKAWSKTDLKAEAKSRQAPEDDFAAQENSQIVLSRNEGKAKKEEPAASVLSTADAANIVNAQTCNGATIELHTGEKRMLDLHNQTRAEHGLSPLCIHPALTKAARDHSQDMLNRDYFSHYSPEGSEPLDRVKWANYTSCGRTSICGENLAVGSSYMRTPERLFEALMNSPSHKANILRKEFSEVGIGLWAGSYKGYDRTSMYTIEFAGRP